MLHNILGRTLEHLSQGNPGNQQTRNMEKAFDEAGLDLEFDAGDELQPSRRPGTGSSTGATEEDWLTKLMKLNLNDPDGQHDLSYAELNTKRKQLTFQAFRDPSFSGKIEILSHLIEPNLECMYRMFKRTGILGKLCYLPQLGTDNDADKETIMQESLGVCSLSNCLP